MKSIFSVILSDSMAEKLIVLNDKAKIPANKPEKVDNSPQNAKDLERESAEMKSERYEITRGAVIPVAMAAIILATNNCQKFVIKIYNMTSTDQIAPERTSRFLRGYLSVRNPKVIIDIPCIMV